MPDSVARPAQVSAIYALGVLPSVFDALVAALVLELWSPCSAAAGSRIAGAPHGGRRRGRDAVADDRLRGVARCPAPGARSLLLQHGLGLSSLMVAAYAGAYAGVRKAELPRATTLLNVGGRVGGSVGAAVFLSVLALMGDPGDLSALGATLGLAAAVTGAAGCVALRLPGRLAAR